VERLRPEILLQLKESVLVTDLQMIRPDLLIVLSYVSWWCFNNNLPCRITSIMDDAPQRISRTHAEGRAIDISTKGFGPRDITALLKYLEDKVGHLGAYSKSDNIQRVAIYHNAGSGHHLHIQVSKEISEEF